MQNKDRIVREKGFRQCDEEERGDGMGWGETHLAEHNAVRENVHLLVVAFTCSTQRGEEFHKQDPCLSLNNEH